MSWINKLVSMVLVNLKWFETFPGVMTILFFIGLLGLTTESCQHIVYTTCRLTIMFLVIRLGIYVRKEWNYKYMYGRKLDWPKVISKNTRAYFALAAMVFYMVYNEQKIIDESFPSIVISFAVVYMLMMMLTRVYAQALNSLPPVTYGTGMACSFFEGYLSYILPSNGSKFIGFLENIAVYEDKQGVVFPVKRLLIIITHSLYCPPDLKEFNKQNRPDLPYLEALTSLDDVLKDVAGVKNRLYRNSAYNIYRPGKPPVPVATEFATPIHTLYRVLQRRASYHRLGDIDVDRMVAEFCEQLREIVQSCVDTRDKCELVFYDDTDPKENLADVLLKKVAELEPNFEEIIAKKKEQVRKNMKNQ